MLDRLITLTCTVLSAVNTAYVLYGQFNLTNVAGAALCGLVALYRIHTQWPP